MPTEIEARLVKKTVDIDTIQQAKKGVQIYTLEKSLAQKYIAAIVIRLNQNLNLTTPKMTAIQVFEVSMEMSKCRGETFEDVILCFKMGINGHFGEIYNRLDMGVINVWWKKYLDLRSQDREMEQSHRRQIEGEYCRDSLDAANYANQKEQNELADKKFKEQIQSRKNLSIV